MADNLTSRVQSLENKFWVAVTVAAVFGISGAFGFSMLHDAQKQLTELQQQLTELKQGVKAVETARDNAIQALKQEKEAQIADFNRQAKGIAKQAVNGEMGAQLDAVKQWTKYIYEQAKQYDIPPGSFASGAWQKAFVGAYPVHTHRCKTN